CASGPDERVTAKVAKGAQGILREGRAVEVLIQPGVLRTISQVGISDQIGVLAASARPRIVDAAGNRERESTLKVHDRGQIPAAQYKPGEAVVETPGDLPQTGEVEHERKIEIGRTAVEALVEGIRYINAVALIGRALIIINHLRPGEITQDGEAGSETLLRCQLKRVVNGIANRFAQGNGGVKLIGPAQVRGAGCGARNV